ncbi:MAG: GatB/YqeY domain-containing protein [Desulfatiglandaceae bacterium]
MITRINNDLKDAMRARDQLRLSCLRMLKTSIKNRQVEKGQPLTDEEIQAAVSSMVRKAREAAKEFRGGSREDLALKEEAEAEILYGYLPEQLTSEKIEEVIKETISDLSASGSADLGKVMKAAMAKMAGRAPGKEASEIARKLLE